MSIELNTTCIDTTTTSMYPKSASTIIMHSYIVSREGRTCIKLSLVRLSITELDLK